MVSPSSTLSCSSPHKDTFFLPLSRKQEDFYKIINNIRKCDKYSKTQQKLAHWNWTKQRNRT